MICRSHQVISGHGQFASDVRVSQNRAPRTSTDKEREHHSPISWNCNYFAIQKKKNSSEFQAGKWKQERLNDHQCIQKIVHRTRAVIMCVYAQQNYVQLDGGIDHLKHQTFNHIKTKRKSCNKWMSRVFFFARKT